VGGSDKKSLKEFHHFSKMHLRLADVSQPKWRKKKHVELWNKLPEPTHTGCVGTHQLVLLGFLFSTALHRDVQLGWHPNGLTTNSARQPHMSFDIYHPIS